MRKEVDEAIAKAKVKKHGVILVLFDCLMGPNLLVGFRLVVYFWNELLM